MINQIRDFPRLKKGKKKEIKFFVGYQRLWNLMSAAPPIEDSNYHNNTYRNQDPKQDCF